VIYFSDILIDQGIVGELGEMKIPLKPDAIPIRQIPYRLNPMYKKKVKA
jgi:hypothetical protein